MAFSDCLNIRKHDNKHVCKSVQTSVVCHGVHWNLDESFPPCFVQLVYVTWCPQSSLTNDFFQLDNLVLIDKIKEQLMAEKIRPPHLPPTTVPSQQTLLVASPPSDGGQHVMSLPKLQQVPGLQAHNSSQPDIALHARPASSSIAGTDSPSVTKFTCNASSLCILHFSIVHVVIFYVGQQSDAFFCPIY